MPIYEYGCDHCGHAFEELLVRSADAADVRCPSCGAREVRRQASAPAPARSSGARVGARAPGCGPVG